MLFDIKCKNMYVFLEIMKSHIFMQIFVSVKMRFEPSLDASIDFVLTSICIGQ